MRKQDEESSGRAAAVIICAGRATRNTLPASLLLYWRGFVPYQYQPHKNNALAARGVETLPLLTHLLPTTVVGSYPQPDWLVDRAMLSKSVPRTRMTEMWRIPQAWLEQAQDDATVVAIRDMEDAGIDIVTDGEIRRESYSNRFATALEGLDLDNPHTISPKPGLKIAIPRVVGRIRRSRDVEVRDMEILRRSTKRQTKITLPGPFTMSQQAKNEFYKDDKEMTMDFADAVNEEAHALQAAGADVIQLDEPWLRQDLAASKRYGVKAINRALRGLTTQTAIHLCFGYGTGFRVGKPNHDDLLTELAESSVGQIS